MRLELYFDQFVPTELGELFPTRCSYVHNHKSRISVTMVEVPDSTTNIINFSRRKTFMIFKSSRNIKYLCALNDRLQAAPAFIPKKITIDFRLLYVVNYYIKMRGIINCAKSDEQFVFLCLDIWKLINNYRRVLVKLSMKIIVSRH